MHLKSIFKNRSNKQTKHEALFECLLQYFIFDNSK